MAQTDTLQSSRLTLVDTAVLPGLERTDGKLCLLLRETVTSRLAEFNLTGGRKWDLILVPNPGEYWLPSAQVLAAERIEAVGWIYRNAGLRATRPAARGATGPKRVLIASGGGGNTDTATYLARECGQIVSELRQAYSGSVHCVQALGPRSTNECMVTQCDEFINPSPRLNELFGEFDLVISTAGYNSVLELAQTTRPVILVPVARSYDDQTERARQWSARLGHAHLAGMARETTRWAADVLSSDHVRRPVRPGAIRLSAGSGPASGAPAMTGAVRREGRLAVKPYPGSVERGMQIARRAELLCKAGGLDTSGRVQYPDRRTLLAMDRRADRTRPVPLAAPKSPPRTTSVVMAIC